MAEEGWVVTSQEHVLAESLAAHVPVRRQALPIGDCAYFRGNVRLLVVELKASANDLSASIYGAKNSMGETRMASQRRRLFALPEKPHILLALVDDSTHSLWVGKKGAPRRGAAMRFALRNARATVGVFNSVDHLAQTLSTYHGEDLPLPKEPEKIERVLFDQEAPDALTLRALMPAADGATMPIESYWYPYQWAPASPVHELDVLLVERKCNGQEQAVEQEEEVVDTGEVKRRRRGRVKDFSDIDLLVRHLYAHRGVSKRSARLLADHFNIHSIQEFNDSVSTWAKPPKGSPIRRAWKVITVAHAADKDQAPAEVVEPPPPTA